MKLSRPSAIKLPVYIGLYLRYGVRRLRARGLAATIRTMIGRLVRWVGHRRRQAAYWRQASYVDPTAMGIADLECRVQEFDKSVLESHRDTLIALADLHVEHWFDLLGSGWVPIHYGMTCRGLDGMRSGHAPPVYADAEGRWVRRKVNIANCEAAQKLWRLIDDGYVPIDWQLDFKSGYRWSEKAWYEDVPLGYRPLRDIKVPWELARFQHAVVLAWAFTLTGESRYSQAFRNQLLDFMANNPPKFGVNWRSTMDVAIRAANWLVAYDLFRSAGAKFDDDFVRALVGSVYDHGAHIVDNLDWKPQGGANHYLADITGLAFVAAYLPRGRKTDAWLALAIQELIKEVSTQFGEDGGHFEGSTSYHRLCAEMAIYGTALILGLPQKRLQALEEYDHCVIAGQPGLQAAPLPTYRLEGSDQLAIPFPFSHISKLERMAEFLIGVTRPDKLDLQIGDNDSGRFIQAHPHRVETTTGAAKAQFANLTNYSDLANGDAYWMESYGDHRHVVAAANVFFSRSDFEEFAPTSEWLDGALVRSLSGNRQFASDRDKAFRSSDPEAYAESSRWTPDRWKECIDASQGLPDSCRREFEISLPGSVDTSALTLQAYPTFGVYVFRSNAFYCAVRCGSLDGRGTGGHSHNDQLSLSVMIGETIILSDPGTYLYTPSVTARDSYRSIRAHNSPQLDLREPGGFDGGFFTLPDAMAAECLYFGPNGFAGRHFGFGVELRRLVIIEKCCLKIVDHVMSQEKFLRDVIKWINPNPPPHSPGYGVRLRSLDTDNTSQTMNE